LSERYPFVRAATMIEHCKLFLFSALNAPAGLSGWQLLGAVFGARWLIFLMPPP
jgi:undecaprenyl-diphosphatase